MENITWESAVRIAMWRKSEQRHRKTPTEILDEMDAKRTGKEWARLKYLPTNQGDD